MPKPRLLVTRRLAPEVEARAADRYEIYGSRDLATWDEDSLIAEARDADAVVVFISERVTDRVVRALPARVRAVATCSTGTDHIDLAAARARGLPVLNVRGAANTSTAELAMLLILAASRRAVEADAFLRSGRWREWGPEQLLGREVAGRRLGIVGMGEIGRAVARRARAFDMEIHYHNRTRLPEAAEEGATYHPTLDGLLAAAEVLSLHAPSTPETRNLLDARRVRLLPRGAVVVNTARGDLVDDDALVAALSDGHVGAAGLDVFRNEPRLDPRYRDLTNTVLLPHVGGATRECRAAIGLQVVAGLDALFAGARPPNLVG